MVLNWKSVDRLKFKICKQIHYLLLYVFFKGNQFWWRSFRWIEKKLFITI